MTDYNYSKATVEKMKLKLEIEDSSISSANLQLITWVSPDSLTITFDGPLSGADETTLNGIVAAHDGTPPIEYEYYCHNEGKWRTQPALSQPTQCYVCASTDIQYSIKHNLIAIINPTANDDNTQGYNVGAVWVNTITKKEYVCLDASTGAAVWKLISNSDMLERIQWDITVGLSSVSIIGSVWAYWIIQKTFPGYAYIRPITITEEMVRYAGSMAIDIVWIALSEPSVPPEQVYWDLTYAVRGEGDSLDVFDYDPYLQAPVVANDWNNRIQKKTRFTLQDVFTGNEGKRLAMTIGRDSIDVLDTFVGEVGLISAYLVKI